MIEELDRVVLTHDLPGKKLTTGDVGTVVTVYKGGEAFEVEFMTLEGDTFALETLRKDDVRPVRSQEIAQAREVAAE
ncbi:MAG: DUF4926 domain-containing protein [Rhodomicrobium sp.]